MSPLRVGLVLGAGGLAGTAFHAGVLQALAEDLGWDARAAPAASRDRPQRAGGDPRG